MSLADNQTANQTASNDTASPIHTDPVRPDIEYPDSDGQPMAENTLQFQWIVAITGSISRIFRNDSNVFVAGDLLWYPVEGNNKLRIAPDTLVAFGRPKGHRGSYRQWVEHNIAPQVVFEVLSPGNRLAEMTRKFKFYESYGVEEYYIIDPDRNEMDGWIRRADELTPIDEMNGWVSPRLGIRFAMVDEAIQLFQPDGQRFLTYDEVSDELRDALEKATQAHELAEQEKARAEQEKMRAEEEKMRAEEERNRAEQEKNRADRLAARLRELGEDYN